MEEGGAEGNEGLMEVVSLLTNMRGMGGGAALLDPRQQQRQQRQQQQQPQQQQPWQQQQQQQMEEAACEADGDQPMWLAPLKPAVLPGMHAGALAPADEVGVAAAAAAVRQAGSTAGNGSGASETGALSRPPSIRRLGSRTSAFEPAGGSGQPLPALPKLSGAAPPELGASRSGRLSSTGSMREAVPGPGVGVDLASLSSGLRALAELPAQARGADLDLSLSHLFASLLWQAGSSPTAARAAATTQQDVGTPGAGLPQQRQQRLRQQQPLPQPQQQQQQQQQQPQQQQQQQDRQRQHHHPQQQP